MKFGIAIVMFLVGMLATLTVSAQTAPDATGKFPPAIAECLRAHLASTPSTKPCGGLNPAEQARIAALLGEIRALKARIAEKDAKLAAEETRLTDLTRAVANASPGTDNKALVGEISALVAAIKENNAGVNALAEASAKLAATTQQNGLASDVANLKARADSLEKKIGDLASKVTPSAAIGLRTGVILLASLDKAYYSGIMASPRLTLNLSKNAWVAGDLGPLVSFGKFPTGLHGRVGVGYDLSEHAYGTFGGSGSFVGYNEVLKAQAFYLMADAGFGMRFGAVDLSVSGLAGPKLAKGSTDFAFGGVFQIGATFK